MKSIEHLLVQFEGAAQPAAKIHEALTAAANGDRRSALHLASKLGQNLGGEHRVALLSHVYELLADAPPSGGNVLATQKKGVA